MQDEYSPGMAHNRQFQNNNLEKCAAVPRRARIWLVFNARRLCVSLNYSLENIKEEAQITTREAHHERGQPLQSP